VVELQARAGVGVERDAGLDLLRAALDHRRAQRRAAGLARVGREVDARAREVAGLHQPLHVQRQRLALIRIAGLRRVRVLDQPLGIALVAAHLDRADAERRSAVQRHRQPRAARFRIDLGAARGDARRGVAPRREPAHRVALRLVPGGLRERHSRAQQPLAAHLRDEAGRLRIARRRSGEADFGGADQGALAGIDLQQDAPGRAVAVEQVADARRKVALRRRGFGRLRDRLVGEAAQQLGGHQGVGLPALEQQPLFQQLFQLLGRLDLDAVPDLALLRAHRHAEQGSGAGEGNEEYAAPTHRLFFLGSHNRTQ
jgi:hypothetical protein